MMSDMKLLPAPAKERTRLEPIVNPVVSQDFIRDAAIVRMLREGSTYEEIGREFGISRQRVYQILQRNGVKSPRREEAALRRPYKRLAAAIYYVARQQSLKKNQHGTPNCYQAGCRCDDCRVASNTLHKKAQAAAQARGVPADAEHGKPSTYAYWGCRCRDCTEANTMSGMYRRQKLDGGRETEGR